MSDNFTLLDGFSEAFFLIDSDRLITRTNRSAQNLFGNDITGQPFVRILRHPRALECLDATLSQRKESSVEIHLSDFPSSRFRLTTYPYEDSDVAMILQDITPLIEAAQMRTDFVANVSHELRSPLTTLLGIIETLQGPAQNDSAHQKQFLQIMQTEAQRMDRLVKDLLSLSKVEENERIAPKASVDLIPLILGVITNLESRKQEGQKIDFTAPKESVLILGDEDQLIQVFQNVLENAINYSSSTGTIKIEMVTSTTTTQIDITDEGIGISREHIPRLTERFYRIEEGRSKDVESTGLGLAIVKHILSRHRGFMNIFSELGVGTKVSISLPLARS